jgi:uncharacterized membrane protein YkvA (DUF1232 family)
MAVDPPIPAPHNSGDPFPHEEFGALVRRMPGYARLAWSLARDPRLSRVRRAALLAAAAYVVSPIDLVPGIIPVVGQLDDLFIALAAIRLALAGLDPHIRAERLAAAGMTQADVAADLRTTGAVTAWLARSGVRFGVRAATFAIRGIEQFGRAVLDRRRS